MKGPEHIETSRLVLRRPVVADAGAIYTRYSSDTEVTKYVGWPRHQSIEQTKAFLAFSEAEWNRWPAGPYLIERGDRELLGGTGLAFETPTAAATGYVLARDAWGRGYATEALTAIVDVARHLEFGNCMLFVIRITGRRSTYWRNAALCSMRDWWDSLIFQTSVRASVKPACVYAHVAGWNPARR